MSNSSNKLPPRVKNGKKTSKFKTDASNKKLKKKGVFRSVMKWVIYVLIIGLLAGIGYVCVIYNQIGNILDTGIHTEVPKTEMAESKPLTILLLGTDYRPDHPTYLSDVVMVATLNPRTKSATVVSLPRDTKIELAGYNSRKLNEYYPVFKSREKESGLKAEDEMKTMISKYLGTSIDYATVLNFQAFRDIVDNLGGVDVTVDQNMCYRDQADGTNINLKAGSQHLSGDQALDFVRYRKSNCRPKTEASDDFDRNKRQSQVLHALIDQMHSFSGLTKFVSIIKAVDQNLTTDVESEQMKNLVQTYWNISKENVKYTSVGGTWRSPYVYVDEEQLAQAKQALQEEYSRQAQ